MSAALAGVAFVFAVFFFILFWFYRRRRQRILAQSMALPFTAFRPSPFLPPQPPPQPPPPPIQYVSTRLFSFPRIFLDGEHPNLGQELLPPVPYQSQDGRIRLLWSHMQAKRVEQHAIAIGSTFRPRNISNGYVITISMSFATKIFYA
jgi:hypothetical protein